MVRHQNLAPSIPRWYALSRRRFDLRGNELAPGGKELRESMVGVRAVLGRHDQLGEHAADRFVA